MSNRDAAFWSDLLIDKILGTYSGSFALPGPGGTGTNTVDVNIATNIPETVFFVGVFSIDGGTTWNGFGTGIEHPYVAGVPQGETRVRGETTNGNLLVRGTNERTFSATVTYNYTVLYNVAIIAKPNQGTVDPQNIGTDFFFRTDRNYQKIAVDDATPISGSNQTIVVPHNLGYYPKVRVWVETNAGILRGRHFYGTATTRISTTTVSTNFPGSLTGTVYTRIYYDD